MRMEIQSKAGNLTLIKKISIRKKSRNRTYWLCSCSCGSRLNIMEQAIQKGQTSCGCDSTEKRSKSHIRHGHSRTNFRTNTYNTWASMLCRCKPESKNSKYHGAIGIRVCKRWVKFENFLADMGEKPEGFSIERKDNSKGYHPSNCKWIKIGNQTWNRRCTYWFMLDGERLPINVAAKRLGVSRPFLVKWDARLGNDGAISEAKRFKRTGKFHYPKNRKKKL